MHKKEFYQSICTVYCPYCAAKYLYIKLCHKTLKRMNFPDMKARLHPKSWATKIFMEKVLLAKLPSDQRSRVKCFKTAKLSSST